MVLWAEILEIVMLVCFGCSWPISVYKSIKVRTSVGKSATFNILLIVGYVAGIISKFLRMENSLNSPTATTLGKVIFFFALVMYFVNLAMITANLILYFLNKRLDNIKAQQIAETISNAEVVENIVETVEDAKSEVVEENEIKEEVATDSVEEKE